jgi:flavin-dependent dehydrogenase
MVLARAGVATVLVDRGRHAPWKVGETLPPAAGAMLAGLGLTEAFRRDGHVRSYGNLSAWGSPELAEHDFIFDPDGPGWHLDRRTFDDMLWAAALEAGADACTGRAVGWARAGGRWELRLAGSSPSVPDALTADVVVDGTGRASWFGRAVGARRRVLDRLVGLAGLLEGGAGGEHDTRTLVEAVEGGWWYSAPVPGDRLVAVFMTDADLLAPTARTPAGWTAALASTTHTAARFDGRGALLVDGPRVVPASSSWLEPLAGPGWVAVGDAAVAHDPLSSLGISAALASGRSAAGAVLGRLGGRPGAIAAHQRWVLDGYRRYLAGRTAYYSIERRWPASPFWRRRRSARSTEVPQWPRDHVVPVPLR